MMVNNPVTWSEEMMADESTEKLLGDKIIIRSIVDCSAINPYHCVLTLFRDAYLIENQNLSDGEALGFALP